MMIRQVKLQRPSSRGHQEDVVWIDNALAKKGKRVVDEEGLVWTIVETYNAREAEDIDKLNEQWREFAKKLGH